MCRWLTPFSLTLSLLVVLNHASEIRLVNWTRSGLADYTEGSPFIVNIGDTLGVLVCPEQELDIWIVRDLEKYKTCSCNEECTEPDDKNIIDPCLPHSTIPILNQPADLRAVYEFEEGSTYYLITFLVNERSGNCNETGLRLVLRVALPGEPTETQEIVATTTEMKQISSSDAKVINKTTTDIESTQDKEVSTTKDSQLMKATEAGLKESRDGIVVGPVIAAVVVALVSGFCAVTAPVAFIFYKKYQNKSNNDTTFCYTEGQLEDVYNQDGTRVVMRTDAVKEIRYIDKNPKEKSPAEEVKIDLSFSQSLQQYEPMKEIIRNSRSSLLKPMEEENENEVNKLQKQENLKSPVTQMDIVPPRTMGDTHSEEEESDQACHKEVTGQQEESEISNTRSTFSLPETTANLTMQQSDDNSDLIKLQTPTQSPTHAHNLSPQSSIASFTVLAQQRATKSPVNLKQASICEDSKTAQDITPVAACDNMADSEINGEISQDEPVTLSHSTCLKKSQSEEFLNKMGSAFYQPQVLPRKNRLKNLSMENLADIDDPKRPIPKPRTLPRPKKEKVKQEPPTQPGDPTIRPMQDATSTTSKRHSTFEKSGEVFDLMESL